MEDKKPNVFTRIRNYFVDSKNELKKVVWPTQKTVFKNSGIVLMMIFIMGVFVALLDAGLMKLLGMVMSISTTK
ncbi:MAG: preprotein translocase subunit SecE [Clostridia bacterium]|nr:preprotein translocase subunit SecE [Clostridia bacterium]